MLSMSRGTIAGEKLTKKKESVTHSLSFFEVGTIGLEPMTSAM